MKAKNLNEMAKIITQMEIGEEISIAQAKEVLSIICELIFDDPTWMAAMIMNGSKLSLDKLTITRSPLEDK